MTKIIELLKRPLLFFEEVFLTCENWESVIMCKKDRFKI